MLWRRCGNTCTRHTDIGNATTGNSKARISDEDGFTMVRKGLRKRQSDVMPAKGFLVDDDVDLGTCRCFTKVLHDALQTHRTAGDMCLHDITWHAVLQHAI